MRECDKDKGNSVSVLQGSPTQFKEWLGAPKDYDFRRLKENVLKKAIEEINLKIDDIVVASANITNTFIVFFILILTPLIIRNNYCYLVIITFGIYFRK